MREKCKMLGQTSGVNFPTTKEGKKLISMYVRKEFSNTAQQSVPLYFHLWDT
jgi:hypothetical protein